MIEYKQFECWVTETYGRSVDLRRDNGIYSFPFTMALFTGWRARANIAAERERKLVEAGEHLVAEIAEDDRVSVDVEFAAANWDRVVAKHKEQDDE